MGIMHPIYHLKLIKAALSLTYISGSGRDTPLEIKEAEFSHRDTYSALKNFLGKSFKNSLTFP